MNRHELSFDESIAAKVERKTWIKVFAIYVVFELVLTSYSFFLIAENCVECLPLYASAIARMLLDIIFTAALWKVLSKLPRGQRGKTIALNLLVFASYFLLWISIRYILLSTGILVEKSTLNSTSSLRYLLYMSWFDIIKFLLKLSAFYVISFYVAYRKAEHQRTELAFFNKGLQLNLLRQQLSPHFYFNTLNNLYGLARVNSPRLSGALHQLSNIMQYVLYDCNQSKVPLKQEIDFLQSYIALEKLRYEENTIIEMNVKGTIDEQEILPLLLIQFVENAFKHGMKEKSDRSWMKVKMEINESELIFSVENSSYQSMPGNGIGISSARRRLLLQYEDRHELWMKEEAEQFSLRLQIHLN